MRPSGFSAATALDAVNAGTPLQAIADARSIEEIVRAVGDALTGLRLGVSALDDAGLARVAGLELWSVAEIIGHALRADEAAHEIARALAAGQDPDARVPYGEPGPRDVTRGALLEAIEAAGTRLSRAAGLAAGGPTFAHEQLGPLNARGWILYIAVHHAQHLHQAAAVVRSR
ncbi:MAG TPA: DinB family protein [Candidatus Limnocylindria bacterium]